MSIKQTYFNYLEHFRQTVTLKESFDDQLARNLIALRHDIDHDLDLALELAYWEHQKGCRSTYFMLQGAEYWHEPLFLEKCLQIQDYGHEIGLHINALTLWFKGQIENVQEIIASDLQTLRQAGIVVDGFSTHGDRLCYEEQFINYWCFKELKPADPLASEQGLSAEGVPDNRSEFQIHYPAEHSLKRSDSAVFTLWSVPMHDLAITYHALNLPMDAYYTDSGGNWTRSKDPLQENLEHGRHQVLIHPEYWRGEQKKYYFLSTARSGSKWLTNMLEKATPCKARHELTLNYSYINQELVEDKHTAEGYRDFAKNPANAEKMLHHSRAWIESFPEDYAEANVYLEPFLEQAFKIFPDATFVHLYRDPRDVVRSIINRNWYDTLWDDRHPVMNVPNWKELSQLEKACWYVCETNKSLMSNCEYALKLEEITADIKVFINSLEKIGIPVYPRLAELEFKNKINTNYNYTFPHYSNWSIEQKTTFNRKCFETNAALGYETDSTPLAAICSSFFRLKRVCNKMLRDFRKHKGKNNPQELFAYDFTRKVKYNLTASDCTVVNSIEGLELLPEKGSNAYLIIGGGDWHKNNSENGWPVEIGASYLVTVDAMLTPDGTARIFCLMYNNTGELMERRALGTLRNSLMPQDFAFKARSDVKRFKLAVYMSAANLPEKVLLSSMSLQILSM
jgi:hypothetical protein